MNTIRKFYCFIPNLPINFNYQYLSSCIEIGIISGNESSEHSGISDGDHHHVRPLLRVHVVLKFKENIKSNYKFTWKYNKT